MNKNEVRGETALLATAVLWSTSGVMIKLLDCPPVLIACCRSFFAALFMTAFRIISRHETPGVFAANLRRAARLPAFWLSGTAYAITMLLFVIANKYTTPANAILLQYSAPIWTTFLAWILIGERPRAEHWAGMLLIFTGLFIFFRGALGRGSLFGDGLALISGFTFAANAVFLRMQKDGDPSLGMILSNIIVSLVIIPFFNLLPEPTFSFVAAIVFMGVFQIGLSGILLSYGMTLVNAVPALLILSFEPILSPVWVFVMTDEKPSGDALWGGALIIFTVIAVNSISARRMTGK